MAKSKIEWLARPGTIPESWNPVTGCSKISEGCTHCYAERMSKRLAGRHGYPEKPHQFDVTLHPDKLDVPLHWKKSRTVFTVSMGDLFHEDVPFEWITEVFYRMYQATQHTFIVLTKRPQRMLDWFNRPEAQGSKWHKPLPNVWGLVTAETQKQLDARVPILLQCPFVVRGVSMEPMLGPVDCSKFFPYETDSGGFSPQGYPVDVTVPGLDWIIVGGETGPGARPMHPDWAHGVHDQCVAAGVPFFFKQWGKWCPGELDSSGTHYVYQNHEWPHWNEHKGVAPTITQDDGIKYISVGKHAAGHLLDGKEWHQWPQ